MMFHEHRLSYNEIKGIKQVSLQLNVRLPQHATHQRVAEGRVRCMRLECWIARLDLNEWLNQLEVD
jgi:hypothetical protein